MKEHEGPHTAAGDRQHVEELIKRVHEGLAGQIVHLEGLLKQSDDYAGRRHGDLFEAIMNVQQTIADLPTTWTVRLKLGRWELATLAWEKRTRA